MHEASSKCTKRFQKSAKPFEFAANVASWVEAPQLDGMVRTQLKKYSVVDFARWRNKTEFEEKFRRLVTGLGIHYRGE